MSLLNTLLLALTLAFTVFGSRLDRGARLVVAVALVLGFALQWVAEGFHWQWLPAYAVSAASLAPSPRRGAPPSRLRRWAGRVIVMAAVLLVLAPWLAVLPVPRLPPPTGPHAVGTQTFRWVDSARSEAATADPADHRNVVVQAWYPAAPGVRGPGAPYIDGLGRLPKSVSLIPRFVMRAYGRIDTHAAAAAPVSKAQQAWPVLLFSPGSGAPRAFYSGLAADLASRGFVVLALDHPYDAAVTQLADGRIAYPVNNFPASEAVQMTYMARQQDVRAADMSFVLDQIERPGAFGPRLSGRLDLTRAAAAGHSFGGAASALALARDPRLKAAVNIDGTLYGDIADQHLTRPFMLVESDRAESGHGERYIAGNQRLLSNLAAPGYRFQIKRANHYSFTDAPLFLSPPARFAASKLIGGGRGPVETQHATADIVAAFLRQSLMGAQSDPAAAAAAYPDIIGGPVR